jgi:hypothetical protein
MANRRLEAVMKNFSASLATRPLGSVRRGPTKAELRAMADEALKKAVKDGVKIKRGRNTNRPSEYNLARYRGH